MYLKVQVGLCDKNFYHISKHHHSQSLSESWWQVAGLQWVKRHISAFSGDPGSITIMGQQVSYISIFVNSTIMGPMTWASRSFLWMFDMFDTVTLLRLEERVFTTIFYPHWPEDFSIAQSPCLDLLFVGGYYLLLRSNIKLVSNDQKGRQGSKVSPKLSGGQA